MSVIELSSRRLEQQLERIRSAVIGDGAVLDGPFGSRRLVYADWTASGRSLTFIEDVIREAVLPLYGNTHTEASATGRRTTQLREDARRVVHRAVGGGPDDVVVFCGSGATGAVDRLLRVLELGARLAAGGLRGALRAPLERAAVAGVGCGCRGHPPGRKRTPGPRSPARGARTARRAAAQDRQLLGRVQSHRRRDRRRCGVNPPPSLRRSRLLGLRGGCAAPARRDEPFTGR